MQTGCFRTFMAFLQHAIRLTHQDSSRMAIQERDQLFGYITIAFCLEISGLTDEMVAHQHEATVQCSPCTVTRHSDHVVLDFGTYAVFTIDMATLRQSAVLADVEGAEGGSAELSQEHIRYWLHFTERGKFHLDVEELVKALKVRADWPRSIEQAFSFAAQV